MRSPKYKVIFRYKNITLWRNNLILRNKFLKQKWTDLNNKKLRRHFVGNAFYICHYKKLKLERLYSFKFMNKQILKKYLVNYKEYNFKKNILTKNYSNFEKRLDFNIYKAHFAESLYAARFYILKGFVLVNGKIITSFNYLLNNNDKVEINKIFFNFIYNKINFSKIKNIYYLRNLEVDYKTLSFIFLNNPNYFVINYQNFLKRIYCISYRNKKSALNHKYYKKVFHNNELKLKRHNFKNNYYRKNYKLNNYFKFFDYVFRYYLFLDNKHKIIKKRYNKYFLTNYELKVLFKVFKKKYTHYFFRNILLKRTFNYKYNYLKLLQSNLLNFKNFENVNNSLYKNNNIELNNTTLVNQYFKYYYNLIFKFYIYLLKNYYINSYTINLSSNSSINNYNYKIILNSKLFKILKLKNKLNYFYISNFSNNNANIQKYRRIKYKSIERNTSKILINRRRKEYYISKNKYKDFLNFIYSKDFKLKFHRYYWNDCRAKFRKRHYICNKLYTSFIYKYYNISKIGVDRPCYSKHFIYNRLVFNFKNKKISRFNKKNLYNYYRSNVRYLKNKRLYYSVSSDIYKYVFYNIIKTSLTEKSKVRNDYFVLLSLIKKLELNKQDYSNILEDLQIKYDILLKNRKLKNLNYDFNIKNLYLMTNLIKYYKKDISNLNLNHNIFNILYKNNLKRNEYRFVNYSLFIFRKNKFVLEPLERRTSFYLSYNKPKLYLSGNIRKYLLTYSYKNSNIKSIYRQLHIRNKYYRFKRIKKYLYKNNKSILQNKSKNNYMSNLNIIDSNLKFNDNLFFIDLFINFNVRKLNNLYNSINYTKLYKHNLHQNYKDDIRIKLQFNNNYKLKIKNSHKKSKIKFYTCILNNRNLNNISKYRSIDKLKENSIIKEFTYIYNHRTYLASINNSKYIYNYYKSKNYIKSSKYSKKHHRVYIRRKRRQFKYRYGLYFIKFKKYNHTNIKYKLYNFSKKSIYNNVNNIYKIYIYYSVYYKKYKLIKYLFNNYIFREYSYILDKLISKNLNIKTYNENYIKQLYFNLLYSKIFNFKKYDNILYNNFKYNRNLKILINYFILIKRFYK